MVTIAVRFTHFPHCRGEEEATFRGHTDLFTRLIAHYVSWVNRDIFGNCYTDPGGVCLDESSYAHDIADVLSFYISKSFVISIGFGAPAVIIVPPDDVVDLIYAVVPSPHDDTGVFHIVFISFSRPVNRYQALSFARKALELAWNTAMNDWDIANGIAEAIIDTNTWTVSKNLVYGGGEDE